MPRLRIKEKEAWKDVTIGCASFVIGRSANCDHTIDSGYISRRHCEILDTADGWTIRDCNSKLGTEVNDRMVKVSNLEFGDTIRLGGKLDAVFMADAVLANTETMRVVQPDYHKDRERLVCLNGPIAEKTFKLNKSLLRIGRTEENDIFIPIDTISKQHAELTSESGQWILRDLNSGNGTFVNEVQIDHHVLEAGDLIRFDRIGFRFEDTHYRVDKSGTRIRGKPPAPEPQDTLVPLSAVVLKKDPTIDRPTNRHKRKGKSTSRGLIMLLILIFLGLCGYAGYLLYEKWAAKAATQAASIYIEPSNVKLLHTQSKNLVSLLNKHTNSC